MSLHALSIRSLSTPTSQDNRLPRSLPRSNSEFELKTYKKGTEEVNGVGGKGAYVILPTIKNVFKKGIEGPQG